MDLMDMTAAIVVGNLLAVWFVYGLHFFASRTEVRWLGIVFSVIPMVLVLGRIRSTDPFVGVSNAAFFASLFIVAFLWGVRKISQDETGASWVAYVSALVPLGVAILWLAPYAPIGR